MGRLPASARSATARRRCRGPLRLSNNVRALTAVRSTTREPEMRPDKHGSPCPSSLGWGGGHHAFASRGDGIRSPSPRGTPRGTVPVVVAVAIQLGHSFGRSRTRAVHRHGSFSSRIGRHRCSVSRARVRPGAGRSSRAVSGRFRFALTKRCSRQRPAGIRGLGGSRRQAMLARGFSRSRPPERGLCG